LPNLQYAGQNRYTAAAPNVPPSRSLAVKGKTILVTGAAGSLGSALSLVSVQEGFDTVMLDSDQRGLEWAYDRIINEGLPEPVLYPADLATAGTEQFETMTGAIEQQFGGLDAVVHCAARFEGLTPLEHISPPDWLAHMQINLNAAWLLSTHCLPLLKASDDGRLYFLLEDLQKVDGAFWGPYGVSKHALRALVSQFSAELKSSRVQVLGINPGPMSSPLRSRAYLSEHPAAQAPPEAAAKQILEYLSGRRDPSGSFIELEIAG